MGSCHLLRKFMGCVEPMEPMLTVALWSIGEETFTLGFQWDFNSLVVYEHLHLSSLNSSHCSNFIETQKKSEEKTHYSNHAWVSKSFMKRHNFDTFICFDELWEASWIIQWIKNELKRFLFNRIKLICISLLIVKINLQKCL